ncbi:myb-related protein 2-like [Euphorbia lathyris]|uniref:myb-related protein 2-like n=1 Tax=Euphorbia lathyris TaxID=212925 RepID=UPI003313B13D
MASEFGDFPTYSDQVTGSLEVGNAGSSLSDLFGYSTEFEHQLEIQYDDFKITSLLFESENDNAFLEIMEQVPKHETDHLRPPPFAIEATDRIQWSPELHERFSGAIDLLGGPERATPSQIFHLMNVTKGLTLQHVKSHLQTYRKILDEVTKAAFGREEATRNASVAVEQGGPSKPRTGKRSKRKGKACMGTLLAKKIRYAEEIQKVKHSAADCCNGIPSFGRQRCSSTVSN